MSSKLLVAFALIALVALGVVLVLEPMRHADEPAPRGTELERGDMHGGETRIPSELSASRWPRDREAPAAPNEPAKVVPEERRARSEQGFGVEGTVIDGEGAAIAGARVQGFLNLDGGGRYLALGPSITAPDGSFFVPAPELESLSFERRSSVEIQLRVRAEGHVPGEWSHGWGDEPILRVEPMALDASRQIVSGRIVDREGRAVPLAQVALIAWGSGVGDRDLDETETFANGEFHFAGVRWGAFDLFASHPRHGIARFQGMLHPKLGAAEVGELKLEARETIGGIVVALDGTPLPGVDVHAELAGEDGGDAHVVQTDEQGRFEFRALMPERYDLRSPIDEDPVASVATGTSDLVLRSKWPSVHLIVRGADGAEVRNAGVSLVEAKDPSQDEPGKRIAWRESWAAPGGTYYLLNETGTFWIHAHEFLGDERYSAREKVELERGHRRLELSLQLEHRVEVMPVVRAPAGEELTMFRGRVRSIEDRSELATFQRPRPLRLRPGAVEFRIEPPADSFWRPFLAQAIVPESGGAVVLHAVERGAGLRLKLDAEGPHGNAFQVQILEAADPEAPKRLYVDAGVAATHVALRAGPYRIKVSCKDYEPQELSFRLEEGRWTESNVYLRAKKGG